MKTTVKLIIATLLLLLPVIKPEPTQDKQSLLSFISQIPHENRLRWNTSDSACNWIGVQCDPTNSSVISLRLPAVGLVGIIPPNTLTRLTQLRILSLRSNRFSGTIPTEFSNLTFLRSLYLQNNQFSGEFPAAITELTHLTRLDISSNNFSGSLPFSLVNLSHLTGLILQNNGFNGRIPSIDLPNLLDFNVSNNQLNGSIPNSLSRFPLSSFTSNADLCGGPLPPCNPFFPAPTSSQLPPPPPLHFTPSSNNNRKLSTAAVIGISVAGGVAILLLLLVLMFLLIRKKRGKNKKPQKPPGIIAARTVAEAGTSSSKDDITGGSVEGGERNKLVFFGGGNYSFDLEDLLRASAEVLGKGSVGTSYKALLEEGTTVVVKRLKDVSATKREFEHEMNLLGNLKHENVMCLRAYYFSKDEKLLVYDFMPAGSLSALLHGSRGTGHTLLDWGNRLRIALSAARGLAHLHLSEKIVHGNIKSSNILLKQDSLDACLSDFGLNALFSNTTIANHRIMGYRAPEVVETRKVTFKSDVYGFGVLLLELLTGKSPNQASLGEEGIDLPRWVQSVVREEWTAEVFDVELMRYHNVEEEMVQLLQIGMACVTIVPDERPEMQEVLRMIDDMNSNRGDTDDGLLRHSSDSQTPSKESRLSPSGVTP